MAGGVAVHHNAGARSAAQQLVQWHIGRFGFDIPQRHIDGGNGGHGHRPAAPVGPFVKELPDIFYLVCIAADELRAKVIFQVRSHRQFAPIECGIAQAGNTAIGGDFQRDEVSSRAGNKDFGLNNFHSIYIPY